MKLEILIDELQEIVDNAFSLPLSGGKTVVNTERIKEIIDEMRTNMPQEVRQAKEIATDRKNILDSAKEEAERIVQQAEDRAKAMVDAHEITRRAQQRSEEIISSANGEASKIRDAANSYIDSVMKKADDDLSENLAALKKTRQNLKTYQQKNRQRKQGK